MSGYQEKVNAHQGWPPRPPENLTNYRRHSKTLETGAIEK